MSAHVPLALDREGAAGSGHDEITVEPGATPTRSQWLLLGDRVYAIIAVFGLGFAIVNAALSSAWQLTRPYWKDEAIAVTVASLPLGDISSALRFDASPPVYYWLLHIWMRAFGSGELTTALLSVLCAFFTVVVVAVAGARYGGPKGGWLAATWVLLSNPWLLLVSETRMYTLVTLFVAVLVVALIEGFIADRRPFRFTASALLLALALTHNWGLVVFGATAAWFCWVERGDIKRLLRRSAYFLGPVFAYLIAWGPTLAEQLRSDVGPGVPELEAWDAALATIWTFGGPVLLFYVAAAVVLSGSRLRNRWTQLPSSQRSVVMLGSCFLCALATTYVARSLLAGWVHRYVVVLLIPVILGLLAMASATRAGRYLVAMGLTATALLSLVESFPLTQHRIPPTSYAIQIDEWLDNEIGVTTRTVVASPSSVALLRWYGGEEHRYVTPTGVVQRTGVFDYRNRLSRLQAHDADLIEGTVDGLSPEDWLVVVDEPRDDSHYFRLQSAAMTRWVDHFRADPDLRMVSRRNFEDDRTGLGYTAYVFERHDEPSIGRV